VKVGIGVKPEEYTHRLTAEQCALCPKIFYARFFQDGKSCIINIRIKTSYCEQKVN